MLDKEVVTPQGLNSLKIMQNRMLPKNTMVVSEDIYEQMKNKPIEKWNFIDAKILCLMKSNWNGKAK